MVLLNCALVGEGSVISIIIEKWKTVALLKDAIKAEKPDTIKSDADKLQLFLAKTEDGAWLSSRSKNVKKLKKGEKTVLIEELTEEDQELQAEDDLRGVLEENRMAAPQSRQIHMLVKATNEPNQFAKGTTALSSMIHSETRRKRWRGINDIVDKKKKSKTTGGGGTSNGYSGVKWSEIKSVLDYELYRQKRKSIPDDKFKCLRKYLTYTSKAMNGYADAAKDFIAPVLIMICNLFDDVNLEVEELVDGNNVHIHGFFEFALTRGKTKICIVEAKRNDFDQGKAQALLGCEAVADREGVSVVYGIVTDFIKWQLYRCGEESIVMDFCTVGGAAETIDKKTLRDMCEMICGALSDHDAGMKARKVEVKC